MAMGFIGDDIEKLQLAKQKLEEEKARREAEQAAAEMVGPPEELVGPPEELAGSRIPAEAQNQMTNQDAKAPTMKTKEELAQDQVEKVAPSVPEVPAKPKTLQQRYLDAIKKQEDLINAPEKEYGVMDALPDILAGLYNIGVRANPTGLKEMKMPDSIASKKRQEAKAKKDKQDALAKLHKSYSDYMASTKKASKAAGKTKLEEEREKNIADRYDDLQEQIPNLKSNVKEAKFLLDKIKKDQLSTGPGAETAGAIGGFFGTEESALKQRLDSLAERAARAQLKANGEVRPTDADVEGMKKALFNLGNTEEANISKLEEFIKMQNASINEYDQMKSRLKSGKGLEDFILNPTYTESIPPAKLKQAEQFYRKNKKTLQKKGIDSPEKAVQFLMRQGKI